MWPRRPTRRGRVASHRYLGRPESDWIRCLSMQILGGALGPSDPHAEISVLEARLDLLQRFWPRNVEEVAGVLSNMAASFEEIGRIEDALRIKRTVYAHRVKRKGQDDEATIRFGNNLSLALIKNARFAEAKQFTRAHEPVARRALGDRHSETLRAVSILAEALYQDPAAPRADLLEAEARLVGLLPTARIIYGPSNPQTQVIETQLEHARWKLAVFRT